MATRCHPKDNGGKYPMWIRVEYTNGEHKPPHAHLYNATQKPEKKSLITKFLLTPNRPNKKYDIQVMQGKPPVPSEYSDLLIAWAKDSTPTGTNNWTALWDDWYGLEASLQ
jgi:hypothetical protein